jgi:rhodanese-related sulfurtransferase
MINIYSEEAERLIKEKEELIILDVRTFRENKEIKIPNSINVPVEELEWEIEDLEKYKDKEMLVYCKAGVRSSIACQMLESEGFKKLYNLMGGVLDYRGKMI